MRSSLSLSLAMQQHRGSVLGRSAVPGIVVLRYTSGDVGEFVKQYHNLCLWSVAGVGRNRQPKIAARPSQESSGVLLHDNRSAVEERSVGI